MSGRVVAYVGSYASPGAPAAGEAGIRLFSVDPDSGSLSQLSASMPDMEAGYLCRSLDGRFLYGVDERKDDGRGPIGPAASVKAFRIDPSDGRLSLINSQRAFGPFPTYVAIDPSGKWVVTASHGSFEHVEHVIRTESGFEIEYLFDDSTLTLYPVSETGALEPACDLQIFEGHGVDPSSSKQVGGHPQASPHAHSATFDPAGRFIMVCEKSADKIYLYSILNEFRRFSEPHVYSVSPGSAPRHPAFHPTKPLVFVTNEMASTLSSYTYDSNKRHITHIDTTSTISSDYCGINAPAEVRVHPSGRFVYVNNRGEDTVVCFVIDEESGKVSLRGSYPLSQSCHPGLAARSFAFDPTGTFMFVADRPGNKLLTLAVDAENGDLALASTTLVPQPAFVLIA
jgi:6-phosphogluconolactonase